jgi:hypothetical protein
VLTCPECDSEGTSCWGLTKSECVEAWNTRCDENYPERFTNELVARMRRGELTYEQALHETADPETFPEYEGQGA